MEEQQEANSVLLPHTVFLWCLSCVLSEEVSSVLVLILLPPPSFRLATAVAQAPRVPSVMSSPASASAKKGLLVRAATSAPWATEVFLIVTPVTVT